MAFRSVPSLKGRIPRLRILVRVHRSLRRKTIAASLLLVAMLVFQLGMPGHPDLVRFYDEFIFRPWQIARTQTLGWFRMSLGDWLYLLAGLLLLIGLLRALYFGIRFATHRIFLLNNLLNGFIGLTVVYLLFFIGWGGNYYKPKLQQEWALPASGKPVMEQLFDFDTFLIRHLNILAPQYQELELETVNRLSVVEYQQHTDSRTARYGLNAKPSLFGQLMQYFGIQGYYNPWTGEAQVNQHLPSFMLPFVTCHEMAHQSGIAAEEDANLLSYALCTRSSNKAFRYSGYFNLWLYTQGMIREQDTALAHQLMLQLNPVSVAHRDTLRAIRERYRGETSVWSMALYDSYLRMHDQKEGIKSYSRVSLTAWQLEQKRRTVPERGRLHVP
ncbi:MAG: DUF3810 domain-containing protein [Sphingobacteriales bacterium]|nr:MAG: DUF3810 domain-containing protein [Sphingobacteriales bacterium]